jgi:hypothetical protein
VREPSALKLIWHMNLLFPALTNCQNLQAMGYRNNGNQCHQTKEWMCSYMTTEVSGKDRVNYSCQVSPSHAISPSTMELNKEQQVS